MVMAYDFNWSGSARAGGVAPIDSPYILDARATRWRRTSARVPASRLIWGVPYYGRSWTTTSSDVERPDVRQCREVHGGQLGVDAMSTRASGRDHGRRWDDVGQVPWYRYVSTTYDTWVQGYYDDSRLARR